MSDLKILEPEDLRSATSEKREFAFDVLAGLSERPMRLPSKYFYDDRGSVLFQQITELEEYYPTRCEAEILETHGAAICDDARQSPFNLVEFGSGDGRKTMILLDHLTEVGADFRYVPIDISEGAMSGLIAKLDKRVPGMKRQGLVGEYFDGLRWLSQEEPERRNLVLFLGSNIGNFDRSRARTFLRRMWTSLRPNDQVLIGFDLKKDIDTLLSAYNDREGVTAEFNLNLLARINKELDADFDLDRFAHYSTYDVFSGAMESYLVSKARQDVYIGAVHSAFSFTPWQPIHTEYSYKYLDSDIHALAVETGFVVDAMYYDKQRYFVDALFRRSHAAR